MADPVPVFDWENATIVAYLVATVYAFISERVMTRAAHDRIIKQTREDYEARLLAERERRIEAVQLAARSSIAAKETAVAARETVAAATKVIEGVQ